MYQQQQTSLVNFWFGAYVNLKRNLLMKYNLSRLPGSYEFEREHLGFAVNSKIYAAREYCYSGDEFYVIDTKKQSKFINALNIKHNPRRDNVTDAMWYKSVDAINSIALYNDYTIKLYESNQNAIPLWTKLVLRKMIIAYLKSQPNVEIVNELTDERKFYTTFIIKDLRVFADLYGHFYDLRVNKNATYEIFLNSNIKRIGKSFYRLEEKDSYKIDPNHPIKFTNVQDELDCAVTYVAYLNLFNRIKQIYQKIEFTEQEHNKKFKAAVIWTV